MEKHIKTLKILIVDDDYTSQRLLKIMLELFGHNLLYASNGIEAVEMCKSNDDIDVILMDIMMPKMDGNEAIKEIRKFNKKVLIIRQSANNDPNEIAKSFDAGCNEYITKPIKHEELEYLINKYVKL